MYMRYATEYLNWDACTHMHIYFNIYPAKIYVQNIQFMYTCGNPLVQGYCYVFPLYRPYMSFKSLVV